MSDVPVDQLDKGDLLGQVTPPRLAELFQRRTPFAEVGATVERVCLYAGNVEDIVGEVKGPDSRGSHWLAVMTDYDRAYDRTRVGFARVRIRVPAPHTSPGGVAPPG